MYIRHDKDCSAATPQPNHVLVTDAFGNSFENWCVDFIGHDVNNAENGKTGCLPQDPDGLLALWQPHNSDNTAGSPLSFIDSPLIPGTTLEEAVTLDLFAVLGLEQDRDLVLYNSTNTSALQLEDDTQVLSTATFS